VAREIVLEGVQAFDPPAVYHAIRLKPGGRMRGDAAGVAGDLEVHYRLRGYPAARVFGTFEAETGRLTLRADEGRLREVVIDGVEGRAAEKARALLALPADAPLRDKDLRKGLSALADVSGGALYAGEPAYGMEPAGPLGEGVRLRVHVVRQRTRLVLRPKGPDVSPLHNSTEGTALGASAELFLLDPVSFHHASVYARGAYGKGSKSWRFALGGRRPFGAGQRLVLGYEFHDLTDSDDVFRRRLLDERPGQPHAFSIFEDYFRRRGHEAYAFLRATPRLHVGASWRADRHTSLPVVADDSIFFVTRRPRPNPFAADATLRSVVLTGRWSARGTLFPSDGAEKESFLVRDLYGDRFDFAQGTRLDSTLEIAGSGLGGEADFRRFIAQVRTAREVRPRLTVAFRLLLGVTGGEAPPERRFALGGQGTLRGYAVKEFAGDRMTLATLEWSYRAPARWPALLAFYDGGVAWTSGRAGAGWRDDAGVGLQWPADRGIVRVDLGVALRPEAGRDRARVHALLRLPF
jgi:hypothetical protein